MWQADSIFTLALVAARIWVRRLWMHHRNVSSGAHLRFLSEHDAGFGVWRPLHEQVPCHACTQAGQRCQHQLRTLRQASQLLLAVAQLHIPGIKHNAVSKG